MGAGIHTLRGDGACLFHGASTPPRRTWKAMMKGLAGYGAYSLPSSPTGDPVGSGDRKSVV